MYNFTQICADTVSSLSQFLLNFFSQFFGGLGQIFVGAFNGIIKAFNFAEYKSMIEGYTSANGGVAWVISIVCILLILIVFAALVVGLVFLTRKIIRSIKTIHSQDDLLKELNALNKEVMRLNLEKDKILSMKVSQIGLNPNEIATLTGDEMETLNGSAASTGTDGEKKGDGTEITSDVKRFFMLDRVDEQMKDYTPPEYDTSFTLPELCDRFRNFAASRMRLYYDEETIRLFISSFASTRLIILQGISGTGKTSLPYAFGKFIINDALIASVQPSWRDRSELFGYFNEFTKRYNETDILRTMYEATYKEDLYLTILDEMNIARVEYYFAEMLSILEMPSRDEWVVSLVPNVWANDPKKLSEGRIKLPENMWYIGTINNDDSTFAVTDKVYDRAMPIDINKKGVYFKAPDQGPMRLNAKYFESKMNEAKERNVVSEETLKKLETLDDFVIEHFRLAFGNRIVKQLKEFIPVYVGCGGTEIDGLDYVLAKKVFRKFEALNLALIRDEISGLVTFMDQLFGSQNMNVSKEYLFRLKKMI